MIRFLTGTTTSPAPPHVFPLIILRHSLPLPLFTAMYSTMKRRREEEAQAQELPFLFGAVVSPVPHTMARLQSCDTYVLTISPGFGRKWDDAERGRWPAR